MGIIATTHNAKCKLCRHPELTEINKLLELWKTGAADPLTGSVYTLSSVQKELELRFKVVNPTKENVSNHFGKHCEIVSGDEFITPSDFEVKAARELYEKFEREGDWNVDNFPRRQLQIFGHLQNLKLMKGKLPNVSPDQAKAAVDAASKRKQSDAASALLESMAIGIGRSIVGQLGMPRGDVIETEAIEINENGELTE